MQVERIATVKSFEFDDQVIEITKFKNLKTTIAFNNEALPILVNQLAPVESFLAAIANQIAPFKDWGVLDAMIISEKEIDRSLLPAFRVMVDYYIKGNTYTASHLDSKVFDLGWLYEVVASQIKVENLLENHLRRKLSFVMDLNDFAKLGINIDGWASKAEQVIREAVKQRRPDKEM